MIKRFLPYTVGTNDDWPTWPSWPEKPLLVDPGDPPNHDDDTTYIERIGTNQEQDFKPDYNFQERIATVATLTVYGRVRDAGDSDVMKIGVTLNNWTTSSWSGLHTLTASYVTYSDTLPVPGGGTSWREEDFRNSGFEWGIKNPDGGWVRCTSLWVEIDYTPAVRVTDFPRETVSRMLRWSRLPIGIIEIPCRPDVLDVDLMEDFYVSDFGGPGSSGYEWGTDQWDRRLFRCQGMSIDPNTMMVKVKGKDLKNYDCQFWDTATAPYTVQAGEPDGPARLDRGVTRNYSRAGDMWIDEHGGKVVQLGANTEPIGEHGEIIEESKKNLLLNSSFDGWTGANCDNWTLFGTAAAIAKETTEILFDTSITAQSIKITKGSNNSGITSAASIGVDTTGNHILSIDSLDGTGTAVWWLYDEDDTDYWDDTAKTWTNSTYNAISGTSWTRHESNPISLDSGHTYLLSVGMGSTSSQGDVVYIGHTQLELGWFPSTRIVTNDPETRSASTLTISNNQGQRCWPAKLGTLIFKFRPNWTSTNAAASVNMGLFEVKHPTNTHYYYVFHEINTESPSYLWKFVRYDGTTTATAYSATASTAAKTTYTIACRWTDTGGEHDMGNYTASIFVDGVKGTDAAGTGGFSEDTTGVLTMLIGDYTGANGSRADGWISNIEIIPRALSDAEIASRP